MCFVLLLSTLFIFSHSSNNWICKYSINSSYGLKQFLGELGPREKICINISIFDYFIVFNQAPDDLKIYEYHSLLNGTDLELYSTYYLQDISIYTHIKALFAYQIITSYKGGVVSFCYGSLPDICKTGIIFTNDDRIDSIFLSGSQNPPYNIGTNDDLCIVSTVQALQSFSVDMQTDVCCDKLFVYQSMEPIFAFSGPVSDGFIINATYEPVLLRFVSDAQAEDSKYIKINMGSDAIYFPYESGIVFYDPQDQIQPSCSKDKCTFYKFYHIKIIIIIIISIIGIVVIFSILFYVTTKCCCPYYIMYSVPQSKDQKSIWQANDQHVEDRGELQGYFALDPILRPK